MRKARWICLAGALLCTGNSRSPAGDEVGLRSKIENRVVLERKGYVIPRRYVLVSPEFGGRVVALHFDEGKRVKSGDLLAELDPRPATLELQRADALVEAAKARLQARIQRNEVAEVAKAELAAAELARASAKYRLDATKIYSPCDGVVISKETEEGCMVDRRHFNGSYAVCKLRNAGQMDVELSVEERDLHLVFSGQNCTIRPEAFPGKEYHGEVIRVGPTSDRAKSAIGVRVQIDLPKNDAYLMPEMGAIVSFRAKE
jgi:membrane fusion protein, multidrug efflux system